MKLLKLVVFALKRPKRQIELILNLAIISIALLAYLIGVSNQKTNVLYVRKSLM
jgi:hypothetical protein